ncbi:LOW QUALITY PROTEIN: unconventional myosin-XV [Erpetoichthys calabaricus]|uniref:LOW QUALITY PROTEIN: unconventional myosin-XV n=1 Tax=Erpetoichthys calabaricus TaxID=27687 RepID=UPI0022340D05|nr:LOW QUALITY PROTEIN: unconventional myosin-XV [Erpetoichthys calabaricus]
MAPDKSKKEKSRSAKGGKLKDEKASSSKVDKKGQPAVKSKLRATTPQSAGRSTECEEDSSREETKTKTKSIQGITRRPTSKGETRKSEDQQKKAACKPSIKGSAKVSNRKNDKKITSSNKKKEDVGQLKDKLGSSKQKRTLSQVPDGKRFLSSPSESGSEANPIKSHQLKSNDKALGKRSTQKSEKGNATQRNLNKGLSNKENLTDSGDEQSDEDVTDLTRTEESSGEDSDLTRDDAKEKGCETEHSDSESVESNTGGEESEENQDQSISRSKEENRAHSEGTEETSSSGDEEEEQGRASNGTKKDLLKSPEIKKTKSVTSESEDEGSDCASGSDKVQERKSDNKLSPRKSEATIKLKSKILAGVKVKPRTEPKKETERMTKMSDEESLSASTLKAKSKMNVTKLAKFASKTGSATDKAVNAREKRQQHDFLTNQTRIVMTLKMKQKMAKAKLKSNANSEQPDGTEEMETVAGNASYGSITSKNNPNSEEDDSSEPDESLKKEAHEEKKIRSNQNLDLVIGKMKSAGRQSRAKSEKMTEDLSERASGNCKSEYRRKVTRLQRVTAWFHRRIPKTLNLRARLAAVGEAISFSGWIAKKLEKRKKQKMRRRMAIRLASTAGMVKKKTNEQPKNPDLKKKTNRWAKNIRNKMRGATAMLAKDSIKLLEHQEDGESFDSPADDHNGPSLQLNSDSLSEPEEKRSSVDAKYAIVLPRVHRIVKSRGTSSESHSPRVSPKPPSSMRVNGRSEVTEKTKSPSLKKNTKNFESSVRRSSSSSAGQGVKSENDRLLYKGMSSQSSGFFPFVNSRNKQSRNRVETGKSRTNLEDKACGRWLSSDDRENGKMFRDNLLESPYYETEEDREVAQFLDGQMYENNMEVHWAQSRSLHCDPVGWLKSETLLPHPTVEKLSKWTMYKEADWPQHQHQGSGGRWETEDTVEGDLELDLTHRQVHVDGRRLSVEVDEVEDLCLLEEVCESAVLLNLKKRFHRDCIYTYIGNLLLSVNPFKKLGIYTDEIREIYQGQMLSLNPPHIFAIADTVYCQSQTSDQQMCIIISGQSGSGKTEAAKMIIQYVSKIYQEQDVIHQPTEIFSILESFGNAKTILNDNSSRFGKYLHIHILNGVLVGSSLSQYLLEKSRVVFQARGERNFHIFYEMLTGLNEQQKQKLYLQEAETYFYLNQGGECELEGKNDQEDFLVLLKCFEIINLSEDHLNSIWIILSSVLQLGNICFSSVECMSSEAATIFSDTEARIVGSLLQVSVETLKKVITYRVTETSYDKIYCPLSVESAIDARDAITKALYSVLFNWLIDRINEWLAPKVMDSTVGIVDIYGFEDLEVNSFEQLCINYANEQLQQFVNKALIAQEQEEYLVEQIQWFPFCLLNCQSCVELISGRPHGILRILDDQTSLPQATDHTFLQKCHYHHGSNSFYTKPKIPLPVFTLHHYAGSVTYQVHNFLNKNHDQLRPEVVDMFVQSRLKVVSHMFENVQEGYNLQRKLESREKGCRPSATVAARFQQSLSELIARLQKCKTLFVRCLKPNPKKLPGIFDADYVNLQLRHSGILETIYIRKEGYPIRIPFKSFIKRYSAFLGKEYLHLPDTEKCSTILQTFAGPAPELYQLGVSKVFLKDTLYQLLEDQWRDTQTWAAVTIQRNIRGFITRKNLRFFKQKAIIIQAHVRGYRIKDFKIVYSVVCLKSSQKNKLTHRDSLARRGQPELAGMDVSFLDIPSELSVVIRNAEGQHHEFKSRVIEVAPPNVKDRSCVSLPSDINNHSFSKYVNTHLQEGWKQPTDVVLQRPITNLDAEDSQAALDICKLILRFICDYEIQDWKELILLKYIIQRGLYRPPLRNEILCQLAHQTLDRQGDERCQRAWLLFASCLGSFMPSPNLEKPLLKYVSDKGFGDYKAICQHKILNGLQQGPEAARNYPSTQMEWIANQRKGKMVLDVQTYTDETFSVEVDSWTTGESLAACILNFSGLAEAQRGWTVSMFTGEEWTDLVGCDYVLDLIGKNEALHLMSNSKKDYLFGSDNGMSVSDFQGSLIPPAPSMQAPGLPFSKNYSLDATPLYSVHKDSPSRRCPPAEYDSFVDNLFDPVLDRGSSEMERVNMLSRRMKGGGGVGPMQSGPFSATGVPVMQSYPMGMPGMAQMPSYPTMPLMGGMMPVMPNMPVMSPMGTMPSMMMPAANPVVPALSPQEVAAQQQAFINQQAAILAQQMTLQALTLSQQQQKNQIENKAPPVAPKPNISPETPSHQEPSSDPVSMQNSVPKPVPPRTPSIQDNREVKVQDFKPMESFQQKMEFFQKIGSEEVHVKKLNPPSKIQLPKADNPVKDVESDLNYTEERQANDEAAGNATRQKPEEEKEEIANKKGDQSPDAQTPFRSTSPTDKNKGEPTREIRDIIKQYQSRPAPDLQPYKPVRIPAKVFLKKNDPKEEALAILSIQGPAVSPEVSQKVRKVALRQTLHLHKCRSTAVLIKITKKNCRLMMYFQSTEVIKDSLNKVMPPTMPKVEKKKHKPVPVQNPVVLPPPPPPMKPAARGPRSISSNMQQKQRSLADLFNQTPVAHPSSIRKQPPVTNPPVPQPPAPPKSSPQPLFPPPPSKTAAAENCVPVDDCNIKTQLHKLSSSVYFSYNNKPSRLFLRKEVFYPREKFNYPYILSLLCEQVMRDTYSDSCFRITREERRKMRDLLAQFHVGTSMKTVPDESIKRRIVLAARDNWANYFTRLFPVIVANGTDQQVLGVSHRGIRLLRVTEASGMNPKHLKILRSYSFADILSVELFDKYTLEFTFKSDQLQVDSTQAWKIKELVELFLSDLRKDSDHVIALKSFVTDDKSLLSFRKGDIIRMLHINGLQPGWHFGSIGGRSGLFPSGLTQPTAPPDYYGIHLDRREELRRSRRSEYTKEQEGKPEQTKDVGEDTAFRNPDDSVTETSVFSMTEFAMKYFREVATKLGWKGMSAEGRSSAEMVQHSKVPIQESLILYLDGELNELAAQNFMNVMRFMGDQPTVKHQSMMDCVYSILQLGKEKESLRDEIYCQLIKQVTSNPRQQSSSQGWRLLYFITGIFACSENLWPYVTRYLRDVSHDQSLQAIASMCEENLQQSQIYGGRRHLPTPLEIEAFLNGETSRGITIYLPGKVEHTHKIHMFSVANEMLTELCRQMGVIQPFEIKEFCICANYKQGQTVRPIRPDEYLMDFIVDDNSVTLGFQRVIWKEPLHFDSDLYLEVHYRQVLSDYLEGKLLLNTSDSYEQEAAVLAALQHCTKGSNSEPSISHRCGQITRTHTPKVSSLPLFGCNVFLVHKVSPQKIDAPCLVAVNQVNIFVVDRQTQCECVPAYGQIV